MPRTPKPPKEPKLPRAAKPEVDAAASPAEVVNEPAVDAPPAEPEAAPAEEPEIEDDQGDEEVTAFENGPGPFYENGYTSDMLPVVEDAKPAPKPVAPPPPGPIVAPEGFMLARVLDVATRPAPRKPFVFVVTYASEAGAEFVREYDSLDTTKVKVGAKVFVPAEGA